MNAPLVHPPKADAVPSSEGTTPVMAQFLAAQRHPVGKIPHSAAQHLLKTQPALAAQRPLDRRPA